ncbi:HAD family hydrolase [Klebsiella oxytoca]|uniref:HAD family hydrolase n=1 Tax=Klebsiella oxytoca TaxID=571 RepID=UPI00157A3B03|nr:HAD-IA family hydrolase [Klebsiella oxytoca]
MKAVIFDMDGVIIDSEALWRRAQREALASLGATVSESECEALTKGKRLDDIARVWCQHCRLTLTPEQLEPLISGRITGLIAAEGQAMRGVDEVFAYARQQGYRIALATSSSHQVISAVLDKLSLRPYFDVISSADDDEWGKPHPAVYLSTLRRLGLSAGQCLVFEDSYHGFCAAQAAGIPTVVVAPDCQHPRFNGAVARHHSLTEWLQRQSAPVLAAG